VHEQRGESGSSLISSSIAALVASSSGRRRTTASAASGAEQRARSASDPAQAARDRDRYLRWLAGDGD
jgi:hypothetical protein